MRPCAEFGVQAGSAAFGPGVTVLNWDDVPGSSGSIVGAFSAQNWIDGPGFDQGMLTAKDLAINGVENFTWKFAAPLHRIGFAVSTGLGPFPSEIDHLGATFNILTSAGDGGVLTLIDPGAGYAAWVEIESANAFSSVQFAEVGNNIEDQYFGYVIASVATGVPEPSGWATLIGGLGLLGGATLLRARRTSPV